MSSIQKIFRTFRSSISAVRWGGHTLEDEVLLYRQWAEIALREERHNDALVFLAKILRLDPGDLEARMLVAAIYHHGLSEPAKAILSYEKVIATAGYDDTNPYAAAAREAMRELSAVHGIPETPPFSTESLFTEELRLAFREKGGLEDAWEPEPRPEDVEGSGPRRVRTKAAG